MELKFERSRFDEAFLYLAQPDARWPPDSGLFPSERIESIAESICNLELAKDNFRGSFSNEETFREHFRKTYFSKLAEHLDGEIKYRKVQKDDSLKGQKAVTRARDDVQAFLKGMDKHLDFLVMNPSPRQQAYLESLRQKCAPTTLNLLDYMGTMQDQCLPQFRKIYWDKNWPGDLIRTLRDYLKQMHTILRQSTQSGGSRAESLSPIMSNLIWVLANIFFRYSGKKPGRSAKSSLIDTETDVVTKYSETGDFKEFCLQSLKLIDDSLPDFEAWNKVLYTNQSLNKCIRKSIKSLKEQHLTGP